MEFGNYGWSFGARLTQKSEGSRSWSLNTFGNIEKKIGALKGVIENIQKKSALKTLFEEEILRSKTAKTMFNRWLIRKEQMWRQRSRINFLTKGDCNTKFYRSMTMVWRRNEIKSIVIDRERWYDVSKLKLGLNIFVKNHFKQTVKAKVLLNTKGMKKLDITMANTLATTATEEEVKHAVWSCNEEKAQGFEEYNFKIFQRNVD